MQVTKTGSHKNADVQRTMNQLSHDVCDKMQQLGQYHARPPSLPSPAQAQLWVSYITICAGKYIYDCILLHAARALKHDRYVLTLTVRRILYHCLQCHYD